MTLLRVEQLALPGRIQPLSFSVQPNEMVGVIGPNGAGKSTLLDALAGLLSHQGSVQLLGTDVRNLKPLQRAQRIGYLPQRNDSAWDLRVEDVVALGRLPWRDHDDAAISAALARMQLTSWRRQPVQQLSGGEQARVWLARVLAGQPQLILADEPVANLDLRFQHSTLKTLQSLAHAGQSVLLAIHDLALAAQYCDRLLLLKGGQLLADGHPNEVLCPQRLSEAYGIDIRVDLSVQPPIVQAY